MGKNKRVCEYRDGQMGLGMGERKKVSGGPASAARPKWQCQTRCSMRAEQGTRRQDGSHHGGQFVDGEPIPRIDSCKWMWKSHVNGGVTALALGTFTLGSVDQNNDHQPSPRVNKA